MVTVLWETWLNHGAETQGLALTRQVWSEMRGFDGYVSHQLLVDQEAANHLVVVSTWKSRDVADRAKHGYAAAEPVRKLTPLLLRPRGRWVLAEDDSTRALSQ